jgi:hypothetical protein
MMHFKKLLFAAVIILTAIFCKNSGKNRVLEVDFYLRFLQDQQITSATVTFRGGEEGTKLAPRTMQSVFFENSVMSERKLDSLTRYAAERPGGFESVYNFRWKNEANAALTQEVRMDPILRFEMPQPWPKTGFAPIKWEGSPLKKGENLVILCENETGETVSQEFVGPTDLAIVPFAVDKLKTGKWSASLVRTKVEELKNGSTTTKIVFDFYTESVQFLVNK